MFLGKPQVWGSCFASWVGFWPQKRKSWVCIALCAWFWVLKLSVVVLPILHFSPMAEVFLYLLYLEISFWRFQVAVWSFLRRLWFLFWMCRGGTNPMWPLRPVHLEIWPHFPFFGISPFEGCSANWYLLLGRCLIMLIDASVWLIVQKVDWILLNDVLLFITRCPQITKALKPVPLELG